jgi:rSAM/selenodomain-associated transferase 2
MANPLLSTPVVPPVSVSVIIPVWRESEQLWENVRRWSAFAGVHEVLIVGAGETPPMPALPPRVRLLAATEPNRGAQQKLGGDQATGDILLFHHADSELLPQHVQSLQAAGGNRVIVGGAFVRAFDERHPRLRWLQRLAAWQQRHWGALYGDQSIFVRRDQYNALGGFPPIPLMEDVEFSRRLRRAGKIALLEPPLVTSARRHATQGSWRTSVRNGTLLLLHRIGVSPYRLHRWYYRELQNHSIVALIWRELICQRTTPPPVDRVS